MGSSWEPAELGECENVMKRQAAHHSSAGNERRPIAVIETSFEIGDRMFLKGDQVQWKAIIASMVEHGFPHGKIDAFKQLQVWVRKNGCWNILRYRGIVRSDKYP